MAMSRKHYRKTADILGAEMAIARNDDERRIVRNIAYSIADMFRQDNPNFDRAKFYAAVGIESRGPITVGIPDDGRVSGVPTDSLGWPQSR